MATEEWKRQHRDKLREYRRKWYAGNKESAIVAVKQRKRDIKAWLNSYKSTLTCSRCSESHPACLEFHHRNPAEKEINLSWVVSWGWSIERIEREIDKCIVLCANCHRKQHWA